MTTYAIAKNAKDGYGDIVAPARYAGLEALAKALREVTEAWLKMPDGWYDKGKQPYPLALTEAGEKGIMNLQSDGSAAKGRWRYLTEEEGDKLYALPDSVAWVGKKVPTGF